MNPCIKKIGIILTSFLLIMCAGTAKKGSETIVDESGDKPEWLSDLGRSISDDHKTYFVYMINNQKDVALGIRLAESEGVKRIREAISNEVTTLYSGGKVMDSRTMGSDYQDMMDRFSKQLELKKLLPEGVYWQKIEKDLGGEVNYFYNIYSRMSIPNSEFKDALARAAQVSKNFAQQSKDYEAKERLDKFLKENTNK